ncbi:hypothetical protein I545_6560 [Mycobacterium kansasii 662]|uniref:Uncharacterized protein n=1 Tax=Mycobacterium kansasii 662 TaxID=1299326 RepID=X7YHM4_MYCKA|nr:hypothetical protein I545_6560 [Mycobacterium kansasii 662]
MTPLGGGELTGMDTFRYSRATIFESFAKAQVVGQDVIGRYMTSGRPVLVRAE